MGFNQTNPKRPQLWQLPMFVFSLGLFGYAAWLLIDPQPGPSVAQRIESARKYIAAERPDPAIAMLNELLREQKITKTQEGAIRLMLAQSLDLWQREHHVSVAANYKNIIEQVRLALKLGITSDAQATAILARSYEATGQTQHALEQYRQTLATDKAHALKWQRKVIDLELKTEALDSALGSLDAYLGSADLAAGERAWALGEKAHVLIDRKQFAPARELLTNAIKIGEDGEATSPEKGEIGRYQYWLGYCAWKLNDLKEAEKHLRVARDLLTTAAELDGNAALLLGGIREVQKDWDGAISFYNEVLQSHADAEEAPLARLARGMCRIARGDEEPGINDIIETTRRIRERPAMPARTRQEAMAALVHGSQLLTTSGNYGGVLELMGLEQQLMEKPTADFFARLARLYETRAAQLSAAQPEAKDRADTEKKLREVRARAGDAFVAWAREMVLSDDKSFGQAMWKAIEMYDKAGDLPRVISALETFVGERPEDAQTADAYLRLGLSYHAAGLFDKAIATYKKLQFLHPRSLAASKAGVPLARAYIAKGPDFYARAEQILKEIMENNALITPEAAEFRESLAELAGLYHRTGRYELAIGRLEEMTQRYPGDPRMAQLVFLMADSYRKSAGVLDAKLATLKGSATTRPSLNIEEATAARSQRLSRARALFGTAIELYRAAPPQTDLDRVYLKLAYFYVADCVYELGQYADAIKLYDDAAFRYQDDPSALAAYVQIVNANVALGKLEEAKAANERAKWMLRRMPQDAFSDSAASGALSRAAWEKWLEWSTQAGLWK
ncbi:MAG: tetratricopeptide repeat protein [Tepidisphaerales bacterium]